MSTRRKPSTTSSAYTEPPLNGSPSPPSITSTTTLRPQSSPRTRLHALLPARHEALLLLIYPLTLLLGSAFSLLSPLTRNAPYSAVLQSHPADAAPSYFAHKRNVFNVLFVKRGWFWTSAALAVFLATHPSTGPPARPVLTPRRARAVLRWAAVTTLWALVTQWCFGPPLIDRGFRFTGGQCELVRDPEAAGEMSDAREVLTHAACKLVGGQWKGGHDVSGHVFLLILGSAMLWLEILPAILRAEGRREERLVVMPDGKVRSAAAEAEREVHGVREGEEEVTKLGVKIVLGVVAFSWWMLLMTAAFFHTWFEKFTGLLVAFIALWLVYFLPRGVPAIRAVLGMPGV